MLPRQLAIRLENVVLRGVAGDAEGLVIIFCHVFPLPYRHSTVSAAVLSSRLCPREGLEDVLELFTRRKARLPPKMDRFPGKTWFRLSLLAVMICFAVMLAGPLRGVRAADGLSFTVIDDKTGQPVACRMHLVGPGKKPRKADPLPFWSDHFVFPGQITLKLPVGKYTFELARAGVQELRGPFCHPARRRGREADHAAPLGRPGRRRLVLRRFICPPRGTGREAVDVGRRLARRPVRHLVE